MRARGHCGAECGAGMGRGANKLTVAAIKAGAGTLQDGGGLILERTGSGGKWTYRYSISGRRRDMGLGSWPAVSLADARKERDRWAAVLRSGADPINERNKLKSEAVAQAGARLLRDVTAEVFEERKADLRGDGTRGRWMSPLITHVLPQLGGRPIAEIHQTEIRDQIRPIWKTKPDVARKAVRRLRIVFDYAEHAGLGANSATVDVAVKMLGAQPKVSQHIPATPWADIPSLYAKLAGDTSSRMALRLTILTAARSWPIRGMHISEVVGDVWTIPAERMKGREYDVKDFRIPLSPQALEIVRRAAEISACGLLFAPRRGRPVTQKATTNVLDKLGEAGRPHGFRTSFRTWAQDTQAAPREIAETALAHVVGSGVERAYARSDLLDQRRLLMCAWADFVTGVTSPPALPAPPPHPPADGR